MIKPPTNQLLQNNFANHKMVKWSGAFLIKALHYQRKNSQSLFDRLQNDSTFKIAIVQNNLLKDCKLILGLGRIVGVDDILQAA